MNRTHRTRRTVIIVLSVSAAVLLCFAAAPLAVVPALVCQTVVYDPEDLTDPGDLIVSFPALETADGESLWCAFVEADEPCGSVILLSGVNGPSPTSFYPLADILAEEGYSSLLLEVRGHGESDGNRLGLGYDEVDDVSAAVSFISEIPEYSGLPVTVMGFSMGGASAVNAFGMLDEIDGLIAVSAYASFEDLIFEKAEDLGIPTFVQTLHRPFIMLSLKLIYGAESVETLRPEDQIKNAGGRPVLLIASEGDPVVPVQNTHSLARALPEAQVWIREGSDHLVVRDNDFFKIPEDAEFCEMLTDFLSAVGAR